MVKIVNFYIMCVGGGGGGKEGRIICCFSPSALSCCWSMAWQVMETSRKDHHTTTLLEVGLIFKQETSERHSYHGMLCSSCSWEKSRTEIVNS